MTFHLKRLTSICALLLGVIAADAVHAGEPMTKPVRPGDEVYAAKCTSCHDLGMSGAPTLKNKAAWTARIAQDRELIYRHAIKGYGSMPTRGTCSTCSDEEIKAAVDYMISRVQ
ncbi:c-type cytochrome [Schauerella aestuarii]|uniref:c-type cytochrome n=1 Tax=Schauerella aestuarii TaxID=2511204 RepID=UPI00136A7164|nr:c-type cytochrome [Achromobacter aestuarii]MYZ45628.1 cytochrome c5 family protein [Achromobacter aestuarii]